MRVTFWGTRGSIAKPGPSTLRYGGNTSCVSVEADDGTLVVVDCGTGIHELAQHILGTGQRPHRGHLVVSHTHWDHIQGFPFFDPIVEGGSEWDIYAPGGRAQHLESTLAGQMSYDHHPITLEAMASLARFHDLTEGVFEVGGVRITTQYLNHPTLTLGYRFEADGAVLVYASDHEPHMLQPAGAEPGQMPVHREDQRHVAFLADADLVVHDAQYTLRDFPAKAGWGHTPVEQAVDYALAAGARRLALFHHDPVRDDAAVDRLQALARKRAERSDLDVFAAAEGMSVALSGDRAVATGGAPALISSTPPRASTVLIVDDDEDTLQAVCEALGAEQVRLLHARDREEGLTVARRERPSLIVVDLRSPHGSALEVCRRLRAEQDRELREVPVLVVAEMDAGTDEVVDAFRSGATDYLSWPVKPTLLRARVRSWLLRQGG